jgi:hypothetical protein
VHAERTDTKLLSAYFDELSCLQIGKDGMFAETAIVEYCLSIAYQGKQTSVFRLQPINGNSPFLQIELLFSLSSVFVCRNMEK